jgi:hypothetical protein
MDNSYTRKIIFATSTGFLLFGINMASYYMSGNTSFSFRDGLISSDSRWDRINVIAVLLFFVIVYGVTELLGYYKIGNLQNTTSFSKMKYALNASLLATVLLISDTIATINNSAQNMKLSIFVACSLFTVLTFLLSLLPDPILDAEPNKPLPDISNAPSDMLSSFGY